MTSFMESASAFNKGNYLQLLSAISRLSKLFSESSTPYIEYRVVENAFCRSFGADNLSRNDKAFDAKYNSIGVGIKTFISAGNKKTEKVAEFNEHSKRLRRLKEKKLAIKLAGLRNERIDLAVRNYGVDSSLYHIVARRENELLIFETDYSRIDLDNIRVLQDKDASLRFEDGNHVYLFNHSKSTMFREFEIPNDAYKLPVSILDDPYTLILELFGTKVTEVTPIGIERRKEYVVLPLYSMPKGQKVVHERSGLNGWNSAGRKRDLGELYIRIPKLVHDKSPNFFPERNVEFKLQVPTGEILSAKVCQDGSKALMTNPNKALSDWLLRKVLNLKEGELLKIERLADLGFDSVIVEKNEDGSYKIDKAKWDSYEVFSGAVSSLTENG